MAISKPTRKTMNIDALKVDTGVNIRLINNYDLPSMKDQICQLGRIITPIVIEGETNVVLSGNRRTLAGQELVKDPSTPDEVRNALKAVDVIVYNGLSPEEREAIILDHGSQKSISRTEVVLAVWRLYRNCYTKEQIVTMLMNALAKYGNSEKKLKNVPSDAKEKAKYLKAWFHGTLDQYIIAAYTMGEYVQQQFVLTHKADDGLLIKDSEGNTEVVEIRLDRKRIMDLNKARLYDQSEEGKGWTFEQGGETFNELLSRYKAEDAGQEEKQENKRPTVKDLKQRADVYKTPAIKNVFKFAAGEADADLSKLADMDDRLSRWESVEKVLCAIEVKPGELKDFIGIMLHGTAESVASFLEGK